MDRREFMRKVVGAACAAIVPLSMVAAKEAVFTEDDIRAVTEIMLDKPTFDPAKEYGWSRLLSPTNWNCWSVMQVTKQKGYKAMEFIPVKYLDCVEIIVRPPRVDGSPYETLGAWGWIYKPGGRHK